jgi:adenylate cyclase
MIILDRIEQRVALPGDDETLRTKKAVSVAFLFIGCLFTIVNLITYSSRGMSQAGIVYILWSLTVLLAALLILAYPRLWLPIMYVVVIGIMVTALSAHIFSGGYQSGTEAVVWLLLGPISAALVANVRFTMVALAAFVVAVLAAAYLEPFAQSIAPQVTLSSRMQLTTGNMIMMGLVATAAALYLLRQVELYRQRADDLLLNVLPNSIAARLKQNPRTIADSYDEATVLFADIVDFTTMSSGEDPVAIVNMLNDIFSLFDDLAAEHGLEKIKTIGDAYMAAAGVPEPRADHAEAVVAFAIDLLNTVESYEGFHGEPVRLRVGINTGPIVAGVIGRDKFIYDLWGDAVNVASRMESNGLASQIQVTAAVKEKLDGRYQFIEREPIFIKGKGMMVTYLLQT